MRKIEFLHREPEFKVVAFNRCQFFSVSVGSNHVFVFQF